MRKAYKRIVENQDQNQLDEHWAKATCFESIIMFVIEEEQSLPGSSFVVRELNQMYIDMLKSHGIEEAVNTTRFVERLKQSLPDIHFTKRKDGKTIAMFNDLVDYLVNEYVESPDDASSIPYQNLYYY